MRGREGGIRSAGLRLVLLESMITAMEQKMIKLCAAAAVLLTAGCSSPATQPEETPEATEPAAATADPAEVTITNPVKLNVLEETADLSGYQWLYDDAPAFSLITLQESIRLFSEKGSGILVYSSDTCPWCNRAIPVLNDVLKEYGLKAYYVDTNMPIAPDAAESKRLYDELCGYIDSIFELDEDGQPTFQIPEVIAVKNGEIVGHHLSLVDSFVMTDNETQMTDGEIEELKTIYRGLIEAAAD